MKKTPTTKTLHTAAEYAAEGIGCGAPKLHTAAEYAAEGIGSELKTEKSK